MGDAIVRCADLLREAVPLLRAISPNAGRLNELCEQIRQIEGEADDIHDAGLKALFRRCAPDAARWPSSSAREIYDHLEKVVDRFEDVAERDQGIVIEHV